MVGTLTACRDGVDVPTLRELRQLDVDVRRDLAGLLLPGLRAAHADALQRVEALVRRQASRRPSTARGSGGSGSGNGSGSGKGSGNGNGPSPDGGSRAASEVRHFDDATYAQLLTACIPFFQRYRLVQQVVLPPPQGPGITVVRRT